MNSKKYVAFLDILGFSDLVTHNPEEKLVQIYEQLLKPIVESSLSGFKSKRVETNDSSPPHLVTNPSDFKINSLVVSDSIILWTNDLTEESFLNIISVTSSILMAGIVTGIPLRGAITAGSLMRLSNKYKSNMDNVTDTVIGKGLVDAYLLEKTQQWSGGFISKSVFEELENNQIWIDAIIKAGFIQKYNVPLKGNDSNEYVLNWCLLDEKWKKLSEEMIKESFEKWNKKLDSSAEEKRNNTVKFFKHMTAIGHKPLIEYPWVNEIGIDN
jgi:hypothetical protein